MKLIKCKKLAAKMTERQCVINYKKAIDFNENNYFAVKQEKNRYWGQGGFGTMIHPIMNKCLDCHSGKSRSKRIKINGNKRYPACLR